MTIHDDDDEDKTPAHTPDAKKSSGAWKFPFNEPGALCGRRTCAHRRDDHDDVPGAGRRCLLCDCPHFVAGGMSPDEQRADTEREMAAVRPEDDDKKNT